MAPREKKAINSEYTLENFTSASWLMHMWYEHKFHPNTYAMILPVEEPHLCRFLVRVDVHGAGAATSQTATRMKLEDASHALSSYYKRQETIRPIHFGTQV